MKSVNRVTLLGNVTRDPELKSTTGKPSICIVGLATNRVWKDATGERHSMPEYHNLVLWGRLAEVCAEYVTKGKPLYVEGYLKTRTWDDAGHKHFKTEVVVSTMSFVGGHRPDAPEADAGDEVEATDVEPVDEELAELAK